MDRKSLDSGFRRNDECGYCIELAALTLRAFTLRAVTRSAIV